MSSPDPPSANDAQPRPRFRFAPSPNGELHLGHALSALLNQEQARETGGTFLLRIEDIDIGRAREHYVEGIFTDLTWLGLSWPRPVLRQSTRFDVYRKAADRLHDMGLLYPCFATRSDIIKAADKSRHDPDGALLYPHLHKSLPSDEISRRISNGEPYCLRLDMPRAIELAMTRARQISGKEELSYTNRDADGTITTKTCDPTRWGDVIIVRKDVDASYHLAVVVDDEHQNITHITRGADLTAATDIHVLLQVLLGLSHPIYHHHQLLNGPDGSKLSKSTGAQSIRALREAGHSPHEIKHMVGFN